MATLRTHRESLRSNPNRYTHDLERTIKTIVPHLGRSGYPRIAHLKAYTESREQILRELIHLIFEAQQSLPYLHIESSNGLPFCWNRPADWKHDYIRYEWGHLHSLNLDEGGRAHDIKNLCLMSARCNQHIQSSLNIEDLLEYEGKLAERIRLNNESRSALFKSKRWNELVLELDQWA